MSMARTYVAPNRPYDNYYDPLFTTHATAASTRPMYRSPAATATAKPTLRTAELPPLQRTMRKPVGPPTSEILGKSRFRYFQRPEQPYAHAIPADVLMEPGVDEKEETPRERRAAGTTQEQESLPQSRTRTVAVQTAYRESGAQTDAFSPDYIIDPNQPLPEELSLVHLKFNKGLPVSMDEIRQIHKLREQRAFEASLPPITDEASFIARQKMVEAREMLEWQEKEDAMQREEEEKLQVLMDNLRQRERHVDMLNDARVEQMRQGQDAQREQFLDKLFKQRVKAYRSLAKHRGDQGQWQGAAPAATATATAAIPPATGSKRRDIIADYTNLDSKVYAPVIREGRVPVRNEVVGYNIPLLNDITGLEALERSLPAALKSARVKRPEKIVPKGYNSRKAMTVASHLEYADQLVQAGADALARSRPVIENVYKKFEPLQRAPTPVVEAPAHEERERAVLLLQRLLRGRAVQNDMYAGKEQMYHLIRELRIAEEMPEDPLPDPHKPVEEALDALQGEVISHALDFVAKDVVRVNEERKIAALVAAATRERRIREAEEAGRRQAEDILRRKREEYLQEIMDVHHGTAERFIDGIFSRAVMETAHQRASLEAEIKADVIDPIIDVIESRCNAPDVIVDGLVSDFLLPEVERRRQREAEAVAARRFQEAAQTTLSDLVQRAAAGASAAT